MAKTNTPSVSSATPIFSVLAKVKKLHSLSPMGKIILIVVIVGVVLWGIKMFPAKSTTSVSPEEKTEIVSVQKSFDFPGLNNQGKPVVTKVKMTVTNAERSNRVMVKDQSVFAKNSKLFLIVSMDLRNDSTQQINIVPGDLVRLSYDGDDDNKYAPDLHNSTVSIAPISTRGDRVGFVIPDNIRKFKLSIGELDKKKEVIEISFGS